MKRVLYISDYILENNIGANQLCKSHLKSLSDIVGEDNIDVVALTGNKIKKHDKYLCLKAYSGKFTKLINLLQVNNPFINNKIIYEIEELINEKFYDIIFIDNSIYGRLVSHIKKKHRNIKIITFYHDVKRNLCKKWLKEYGIKYTLEYLVNIYNEWLNMKWSDINITLNNRENEIFKRYYYKDSDLQLPIYLEDKFEQKSILENYSEKLNLLFVGAYYYPNVKGIKWFIENVMIELNENIELYIIGREIEKIKDEIESKYIKKNIHIIGEVQSLSEWYNKADVVIAPIFEGAGMKVKTAEALMYGKTILATDEALEGYDKIDIRCNNEKEFIENINLLYNNRDSKLMRLNKKNRKIYIENYSLESAELKLRKIINQII